MENVATYSEARSEYTKQMATFIVPTIVSWFQNLWSRTQRGSLAAFQSECEEIPRWNQDRIQDEVRILIERSRCDYMEELMTAVFIAHTKVLTAVRLSSHKKQKLSITVPKLDHFLHRVFCESARVFWKTAYLFIADGGAIERQKNLLQIEALVSEAITTAVRGLLPVKQILHDYLDDADDCDELDTLDEKEKEKAPLKSEEDKEDKEVKEVKEDKEVKEVKEVKEDKEVKEIKEIKEITEQPEKVKEIKEIKEQPENKEVKEPSIVTIDTEPTVHFSDYDSVFDEEKGKPQMRYAPKNDENENESEFSDKLTVDETSVKPVSNDDDIVDLDEETPTSKIHDDEVEILA